MKDQPTPDRSCCINDGAQDKAPKVRTDAFRQGLPKMYGAIESSHWQDTIPSCIFNKGNDQKPSEKQLYSKEIHTIAQLKN